MHYPKSHIAYCSNVHPGQSLSQVINNIQSHFTSVKNMRHINKMASGLWLSAEASTAFIESPEQQRLFKETLKNSGMLLTSLNGFPYGNFHQGVVKQNVYLPTWAQQERLDYSIILAKILADCLPNDICFGAISTLPLGYLSTWNELQHKQALTNLVLLCKSLQNIEENTGKRITVCIEMEPDCVLQSTAELIHFFIKELIPFAEEKGTDKDTILRYIGCCFDTCHQGVMNENVKSMLTQIIEAGITIGKIQISNAIQARLASEKDIKALTTLLQDDKFLHQTKVFNNNKLIAQLDDLSELKLLNVFRQQKKLTIEHDGACSLIANIHYHIPINQTQMSYDFISSTQSAIESTLDFLNEYLVSNNKQTPYLEIETYTWLNFLSEQEPTDKIKTLHQGLYEEFVWLESALASRSMLIK